MRVSGSPTKTMRRVGDIVEAAARGIEDYRRLVLA
jgi:hypothetical protein